MHTTPFGSIVIYLPAVLFLTLFVISLVERGHLAARRNLIIGLSGIGAVLALGMLYLTPVELSAGDPWSARVTQKLAACPESEDGSLCLAQALNDNAFPANGADLSTATGRFLHDMAEAQALLAIPKARDLLHHEFGVDAAEFLGTGFSVPSDQIDAGYAAATQREFLTPNVCADSVDQAVCPHEAANVWTWRLSADEASHFLNRPLSALLAAEKPVDHQAEWRRLHARTLLVRFARFDAKYYGGKVGRPASDLVFFAPYDDAARNVPLRTLLSRTGSAALAQPGEPGETMFVWVYAPSADEAARPATWASIYEYLRSLQTAAH